MLTKYLMLFLFSLFSDCATVMLACLLRLAAIPKDDWVIVVGHHPADEIDVEDFTSAMQEHGFDLYLNGHAHTLTHYAVDGNDAYVTTGAGAMVDTGKQPASGFFFIYGLLNS